MTEIATIDRFGRWGTSVFSENTAIFVLINLMLLKLMAQSAIQATHAMSTSRISILPLMSKWFFIPKIISLYFFAFQLSLCRKRLTWSNGYLQVIFHALDVFSIIFATVYVEVKSALVWAPYCLLRLCTCISWGANIFQTTIKIN